MSVKLCEGKTKTGQSCKKTQYSDYCHHHLSQKPQIIKSLGKTFKKKGPYLCEKTNILINKDRQEISKLKSEMYKMMMENETLKRTILNEREESKNKIDKLIKKNGNQRDELGKFSKINCKKNERIKIYKDKICTLKSVFESEQQKSESRVNSLKTLFDKKLSKNENIISKITAENKELNKVAKKYRIIVEFEKMKSQLKSVFNWTDQKFYIEIVRKETKYHYILENMFNMSITKIIEEYWRLRRLRLNYAHPFG